MAHDGGGVGSSLEKEYVAGCVTRNAFVSSNALRVTQPATSRSLFLIVSFPLISTSLNCLAMTSNSYSYDNSEDD